MEEWELRAREAVRHTIAAYNFGGDRGRLDELANAFSVDGVLQIGSEAPIVGRLRLQITCRDAQNEAASG